MKDLILKHALLNAIQFGEAQMGSVLGKVIAEKPELKLQINDLKEQIQEIINEVNAWDAEKRKLELDKFGEIKKPEKKQRQGLPELPNAIKGKVVMRMAPFPSGPLHIGNAKPYLLNDEYVKMYGGKLLLVIDDTAGSEQKQIIKEAYDLIPEGLKWLGIKFDKKIIYKSARLKLYYKYAEELIKKGFAYVCECDFNKLRENRSKGIACEHRLFSEKENLAKWKKMLNGKYKEGQAVLRLKTDINHPNPAFRDRVLFRISDRKHLKTKAKVWPLLEFSWAVDDHLLGVTHVLRGKDLMMESEMEKFIWNVFGWEYPELLHSGMVILEGVKLSKSKAQLEVKKGLYKGWDDPRTWSLQSLKKRGILPEAIRKFALETGFTQHDITVPIDNLYAENRRMIDATAKRYFFVAEPTEITLDKIPIRTAYAPSHPEFKKLGKRKIPVTKKIYVEKLDLTANRGREVRLMHMANIVLERNARVTGKVNKDIPKIHWVSQKNVKIKLIMPDGREVNGLGEPEIKKVKKGQTIQMERIGFVRYDGKSTFYYAHK